MRKGRVALHVLLLAVSALLVLSAGACDSGKAATTTPSGQPGSAAGAPAGSASETTAPATAASSTTVSTAAPTTTTTLPRPKEPYTLLVLGTDWRPPLDPPGNSDVIMLLRVDPDQESLSILQITRDLWVSIPGYGKNKLNQAYLHGGARLSTATIEQAFGLDIDHYLVLGFTSFLGVVGSVNGVYVDVDRAYDPFDNKSVAIPAGYQLIDAPTALTYSRMRKDSNSVFGRMSRQLWLMSGAREQVRHSGLAARIPDLVSQAWGSLDTDLSAGDLTDLVTWMVSLNGDRIRPAIVKGPGKMIDGLSTIVIDTPELQKMADDFLAPLQPLALPQPGSVGVSSQPPIDLAAWKTLQARVPFGLEAPAFIPEGFKRHSTAPAKGGTYDIMSPTGPKPGVRVLYRYGKSDLYVGITATTWTDAPAAAKGTEVEAGGTVYTIVGPADKVSRVWWVRDGVLYFITNTVMWSVEGEDLLKMALSMVPVADG